MDSSTKRWFDEIPKWNPSELVSQWVVCPQCGSSRTKLFTMGQTHFHRRADREGLERTWTTRQVMLLGLCTNCPVEVHALVSDPPHEIDQNGLVRIWKHGIPKDLMGKSGCIDFRAPQKHKEISVQWRFGEDAVTWERLTQLQNIAKTVGAGAVMKQKIVKHFAEIGLKPSGEIPDVRTNDATALPVANVAEPYRGSWSAWLDLQGFSAMYRIDAAAALMQLRSLVDAVYRVGTVLGREVGQRLFAHQFGDGVLVTSSCLGVDGLRPFEVVIAIQRHLIAQQVAIRSAITTGQMTDISGCYPKEIPTCDRCNSTAPMGTGVITLSPVMGIGLVGANKLSGSCSGAVLLALPQLVDSTGKLAGVVLNSQCTVIDWVHVEIPGAARIASESGLRVPTIGELERHVRDYVKQAASAPVEWRCATLAYNNLPPFANGRPER